MHHCDVAGCMKKYTSKDMLKAHMYSQHGILLPSAKELVCGVDGCTQKFVRHDILRAHKANIHGLNRQSFKCDTCDKTFSSKVSLWYHKGQCHPDPKRISIKCEFPGCTEGWIHSLIVYAHFIIHTITLSLSLFHFFSLSR